MAASEISAPVSSRRGWYVVVVCMLAYVLSFVDRQILGLLIGPIKADLGISDTQFALLHGFAFSLFYATLGVPIAGLADRSSRPRVIGWGIAVWSVATAACGLAGSFGGLFAARVMVGAGEGALSPASYSLIHDLFAREKLGRALGVFSLGSFLGAGLAFLTGGAVIAMVSGHGPVAVGPVVMRPWQVCFLLVGLPGLLLSALVALTIRDPRAAAMEGPGLGAVWAMLRQHRAIFGPTLLGYGLSGWALFGALAWAPAVLMRGFAYSPAQAGLWLGAAAIVAGGSGAFTSGWLLDRLARAGRGDAPLLVGMIGSAGSALFGVALALAQGTGAGLVVITGLLFFASFPITPSSTLVQIVAPPQMRARVSAILICCTSLCGAGLGTLLIGLLNDHLFGTGAGVTYSLASIVMLGGMGAVLVLSRGCAALRALATLRA